MSDELREIYIWLRMPVLPSDDIPPDFRWRVLNLLKDLDLRINALEVQHRRIG